MGFCKGSQDPEQKDRFHAHFLDMATAWEHDPNIGPGWIQCHFHALQFNLHAFLLVCGAAATMPPRLGLGHSAPCQWLQLHGGIR